MFLQFHVIQCNPYSRPTYLLAGLLGFSPRLTFLILAEKVLLVFAVLYLNSSTCCNSVVLKDELQVKFLCCNMQHYSGVEMC